MMTLFSARRSPLVDLGSRLYDQCKRTSVWLLGWHVIFACSRGFPNSVGYMQLLKRLGRCALVLDMIPADVGL